MHERCGQCILQRQPHATDTCLRAQVPCTQQLASSRLRHKVRAARRSTTSGTATGTRSARGQSSSLQPSRCPTPPFDDTHDHLLCTNSGGCQVAWCADVKVSAACTQNNRHGTVHWGNALVEHQHRLLPDCERADDICAADGDLQGLRRGAQQRPVLGGARRRAGGPVAAGLFGRAASKRGTDAGQSSSCCLQPLKDRR